MNFLDQMNISQKVYSSFGILSVTRNIADVADRAKQTETSSEFLMNVVQGLDHNTVNLTDEVSCFIDIVSEQERDIAQAAE